MLKFADLEGHHKMEILTAAINWRSNFLFGNPTDRTWIQGLRDLRALIQKHLPDIEEEHMMGLVNNSEQIYCQLTHMPRPILGLITLPKP